MTGTLTFDPVAHCYRRDGVTVLGVTEILRRCGFSSPFWTDAARERGTRVHRALHTFHTVSDEAAQALLAPTDVAYYHAGVLALDLYGLDVLAVEEIVDGTHYAGTLDLRCRMRGRERPVVIDYKNGRAAKWTPLQLAAYAATFPEAHDRAFIELQASGSPKLTLCHETLGDLRSFHACLAVAQLQRAFGIGEPD